MPQGLPGVTHNGPVRTPAARFGQPVTWWQAILPVVVVAALCSLVIGLVLGATTTSPGTALTPAPSADAPATANSSGPSAAPTGPVKVDPATITATATSVLPPDPDSYDASKTLDGDPATAWNSDGNNIGPGGRPVLTYTFAQPVRITRIEVRNGHQKNDRLYSSNRRVRTLIVTAGSVSHTFTLADEKAPQALDFDFGVETRRISLQIGEVYAGSRYYDIALSEVSFFTAAR